MFPFWNKRWLRLAVIILACGLVPATSKAELDPVVSRSWEEPSPALLKFQYRLFPLAEVEKVEVTQNGAPLAFRQTPFANNPLNTSALVVLVDTSVGSTKAPRDRTIADNKQLILALLAQAQSRHLIGVSSFANDLVEVAPPGAPFSDIRHKINTLKADGLGTRIYRRGMDAIEKLAHVDASRRALLIVSDGKDEDTGFTKDDLIKAALQHHVMVFAMGCPETETDIPALGNLEKIAAETRGLYAQAQPGAAGAKDRLKADAAFAQAVLDSVDSGGEIVVPLESADPNAPILIELTTKSGEKFSTTHQRHPEVQAQATPEAAPLAPPSSTPAPAKAPVRKFPPTQDTSAPPDTWAVRNLTVGNAVRVGAIVLLLASLVVIRWKKAHAPAAPLPEPLPEPPAPLAFLEMQDADSKRIPITKTASRIGRHADNDIVFANTSISGYHAEIHAKRDGTFYITDLGSGNGVRVNETPIAQSADLKEGDLIELGEVRFRFRRN